MSKIMIRLNDGKRKKQRSKVNLKRTITINIGRRKITLRVKQFVIIFYHNRINNDPVIKYQERKSIAEMKLGLKFP